MRWWIVIVAIVLILAVILTIRAFYEYASLVRTDYEIETEKFPAGKRLRLLVLSDLHDRVYGPENEKLLDLMKSCEPDAILLTGGLMRYDDITAGIRERCGWIAPIVVYPGEMEQEAMAFPVLKVLRGQAQAITYSGKNVWQGFEGITF